MREVLGLILLVPLQLVFFPLMLFEKDEKFKWPTPDRFVTKSDGSFFHWLKNIGSEVYRADCEFWSKGSMFAFDIAVIAAIVGWSI